MPPKAQQTAGQKRKTGPGDSGASSVARKRQKGRDARAIPTQAPQGALSATGELNIAAFVKAREFEINALDKSMQKAKKSLMARAFQQVPRNMRRRTASHNVKKVPKRLRPRAEREMKEDNTPTVTSKKRVPSRRLRQRMETVKIIQRWSKNAKSVRQKKREAKRNAKQPDPEKHVVISRMPRIKKNKLAEPPTATIKFRRRQVRKTWLPTHLWHAKRAHMTIPTETLWRMTIPISPTEKSYRPSHYASGGRGCIAWDTSYTSTIACRGVAESLQNMLKAIGFHGEGWTNAKYHRWRRGVRFADGWVRERDNDQKLIAPISVVWCTESPDSSLPLISTPQCPEVGGGETSKPNLESTEPRKHRVRLRSRLMIRIHPSAFHQFWLELIKVAKLQRPQVLLEDLRFEIGSIETIGPASTEALVGTLKPIEAKSDDCVVQTWTSLSSVTNPASLPPNCLLALDIADPRLQKATEKARLVREDRTAEDVAELVVSWPPDKTHSRPGIFSHKLRYAAGRALLSQKGINRRKARVSASEPHAAESNDPAIPIMVIASRQRSGLSNAQGIWTILLPWKCVDPVWRSLMYYPLTSGGIARFGGLDERRQITLEHSQPWFPGDAPGTEAGKAWERTRSAKRFDEWARRPPSRRVAWETVDLGNGRKGEHGNGWACDWEFLFNLNDNCISRPAASGGGKTEHNPSGDAVLPKSKPLTQRQRKAAQALEETQREEAARRRNTSSPESVAEEEPELIESELLASKKFVQLAAADAISMFTNPSSTTFSQMPALATVRITLLGRGNPDPCARVYRLPSSASPDGQSNRNSYLDLEPTSADRSSCNSSTKDNPRSSYLHHSRQKKDTRNHWNIPKKNSHLPYDPPIHVQYLPPDALPEVVAQYGPTAWEARSREEHDLQIQRLLDAEKTDAEERAKHPPCPGREDLIGFVTSGGFNLAEGHGTAIAGLWVQRLVQGWKQEGDLGVVGKEAKRKLRERRLCVVRNAGEGVGRLGIWEVCD